MDGRAHISPQTIHQGGVKSQRPARFQGRAISLTSAESSVTSRVAAPPDAYTPMMEAQVAIIGGGPAGAICAAELARRSIDVCLVESRPFPREKTCGEFLTPPGVAILESFLGAGALAAAGARPVRRLDIFANDRRLFDWPISTGRCGSQRPAWSLSRETLDTLLLQHAVALGTRVLQPEVVRSVMYERQQVCLQLGGGELGALCVVHADGSGRHDPAGPTPLHQGVIGAKTHFRLNSPLDGALELHGFSLAPLSAGRCTGAFGRGYFGLVEVERGLANLAMVVDRSLIGSFAGDFDALLTQIWPGACHASRVSAWHSSPVAASGYVHPGHCRSFRIGNAAAAVEPVGGEGIGLALWAGSLLGRTLALDNWPGTQQAFALAYRQRLRWRRPVCRVMAAILSHPGLLATFGPLLSHRPGLALAPLYRLSGKLEQAG
jgi:menaquinone-9 beta-reductase